MERGKPRLTDLLSLRLFGVAALMLAIICGFWVHSEYRNFEARAERIRLDMLATRKAFLRDIVHNTIQSIEYQRRQIEDRTRSLLVSRVDNAAAIAGHLWDLYGDREPRTVVESRIREALRPLRYDGGRGYVFAVDVMGRAQLSGTLPAQEGHDMIGARDADGRPVVPEMIAAVTAGNGASFYEYRWTRPDHPGGNHRKLAYLRLIEPLNWVIGTGEYLEDVDADIRQEVAAWLESIRYGSDGYMFAADWNGLVIAGPGKGQVVRSVTDARGLKVVEALIATARGGGGFVEYVQPHVQDDGRFRTEAKLSYVEPVADWQWYVGAGVYIGDVETEVAAARATLERQIFVTLIKVVLLVVVLAVLMYALSRRATRSVARDVAAFEAFFAADGRNAACLDACAMTSAEFTRLAQAAHAMAAARNTAERGLADRTRQLELSNTELERFAWIASHDLQEPLRTVASFLQLLERRLDGRLGPEEREYLAYAVAGARRMRAQIQGLLAYARRKAETPNPQPVSLQQVVEETLAALGELVAEAAPTVEAANLPEVVGDPDQISTIMQNLLSNALRFRDPARPLTIRVTAQTVRRPGGPAWRIAVSDSGIGIPQSYRGDAFALLKRLHADDVAGTGIGLSVAKALVEAHGGEIGMDDGLDGCGLTVWFTLPQPDALRNAA